MQRESRVRSTPIIAADEHKPSAIFSRADLDRARGPIERLSAWTLLLLSVLGTVVCFSGGWSALFTRPTLAAVVGGIAVQAALTAVEWIYGSRRRSAPYLTALVLDASLTATGYEPLARPWLERALAGTSAPELFATAIIGAVAVLLAAYPESRLVE